MIVTRLDSHGNAKIPGEVAKALGLGRGDEIGFHISDGTVSLFRNPPDDEIDEETGLTIGALRALIKEAIDDPRPSIPAEQAFAELREHVAARHREKRAAKG